MPEAVTKRVHICSNCWYWDGPRVPVEEHLRSFTHGLCLVDSPVLTGDPQRNPITASWPTTHPESWCGEWKAAVR